MMQNLHSPKAYLYQWFSIPLLMLVVGACGIAPIKPITDIGNPTPDTEESMTETEAPEEVEADVISVRVSGDANAYQFSVEVLSPDTGCEQYADWWEVLSEDGSLIYRRILTHSHVNEQPFVRSGGAVQIDADDIVFIRAHMHPSGYGGRALKGSVQNGFQEAMISSDFAAGVEEEYPQPSGCAM